MTPNDVSRLYHLIDALRNESKQHLTEMQKEVQGYRADLNGRLKALELEAAEKRGEDMGRGSIGRMVMGTAAVSAAIGSIVALIATLV